MPYLHEDQSGVGRRDVVTICRLASGIAAAGNYSGIAAAGKPLALSLRLAHGRKLEVVTCRPC